MKKGEWKRYSLVFYYVFFYLASIIIPSWKPYADLVFNIVLLLTLTTWLPEIWEEIMTMNMRMKIRDDIKWDDFMKDIKREIQKQKDK